MLEVGLGVLRHLAYPVGTELVAAAGEFVILLSKLLVAALIFTSEIRFDIYM